MSHPSVAREYQYTQLGSYNNLVLKEKKVKQPHANEVLVKAHAVSLQYLDLMISKGTFPTELTEKGYAPCSDMAGEIVAVGDDVKDWKVGDRVCANFVVDHIFGDVDPKTMKILGTQLPGVLTEYRTFPAHSLVHIPEHLSYEEASTLPCAAVTAYNALTGATSNPLKAGDYVLVQGTGGVSIFALQFAVASGAVVIITSSSDKKLEMAAKLGAKHLINYNKTPQWDEEVKKITNGRGVDRVIEVGGDKTLLRSINAVRIGGSISLVGTIAKELENSDSNVVFPIISKAIAIRGIYVGSLTQFQDMNRLITANPEETRPVVDRVFPFEQAVQAYAHLESQEHVGRL
ncbi:alcohol dehydrogenase superfamily protein [Cyathus striatus]|nr:alcohol dehydrogenase superfamily protein [Cyathus striatus]